MCIYELIILTRLYHQFSELPWNMSLKKKRLKADKVRSKLPKNKVI